MIAFACQMPVASGASVLKLDVVVNFWGSCPKSVMARQVLWMLELASQRGFRERARHRVSAPAYPGNVDGAGFFDSMGRNVGLSGRSEPAPAAESVPGSSKAREIGHAMGVLARHGTFPTVTADPLCCGKPTTH